MPAPVALLIEDSKEYALIGAKLLQREGFDVVVAHDGETGLGLARSRRWDRDAEQVAEGLVRLRHLPVDCLEEHGDREVLDDQRQTTLQQCLGHVLHSAILTQPRPERPADRAAGPSLERARTIPAKRASTWTEPHPVAA